MINLLLPLVVVTYLIKGKAIIPPSNHESSSRPISLFERNLIFYLGLGLLVAVPAFKTITHLPPFMGILFALGILWATGELLHREKEPDEKKSLTLAHALKQIDMASIVFFIGILLAVATLRTHPRSGDAGEMAGSKRGPSRCDCSPARPVECHRGQCAAGGSFYGHV